jgi:hypothetical protein
MVLFVAGSAWIFNKRRASAFSSHRVVGTGSRSNIFDAVHFPVAAWHHA